MNLKNAIIITAGKRGKHTYGMLKDLYSVVAFADNDEKKWGEHLGDREIISLSAAVRGYKKNVDCFILPAGLDYTMRYELYSQLISLGVAGEDIFIALENENGSVRIKEIQKITALPYLEIPLVEHCNLNCRGCSHFSPLAKETVYDLDEFKKDILQFKGMIDTISLIRILGGEPLLHPQIIDFIVIVRNMYPESEIRIVTNGILLNSMSVDFWEAVKEHDVVIQITLYPIFFKNEEKLIAMLRDKKVLYKIYRTSRFRKPIRAEERNVCGNLPKDWIRCHCTNLYKGKFSACAMVMFMPLFNHRFGCNYSCEGVHDLYDEELTGEKMIDILGESIPFCNYCELIMNDLERENENSPHFSIWKPLKEGEEKMEDWIG